MLLTSFLPDNRISVRIRGFLISLFIPGNPKGFKVGRDVTLLGINHLHVGDNVYIAKGTWINALGKIVIEDEVVIAPYVVIASTKHGFKNNSVYQGGTHFAPIKIGWGTWIASHCTIALGVTVGSGSLISANSVVIKSVKKNSFVSGVPGKKIKDRIDNPGI